MIVVKVFFPSAEFGFISLGVESIVILYEFYKAFTYFKTTYPSPSFPGQCSNVIIYYIFLKAVMFEGVNGSLRSLWLACLRFGGCTKCAFRVLQRNTVLM